MAEGERQRIEEELAALATIIRALAPLPQERRLRILSFAVTWVSAMKYRPWTTCEGCGQIICGCPELYHGGR